MIALYIIAAVAVLALGFVLIVCFKMIGSSFGRDPHTKEHFEEYIQRLKEQGSIEMAQKLSEGISVLERFDHQDVSIVSFDGTVLKAHWLQMDNAQGTVVLAHGYHSHCTHDMGMIVPFYRSRGYNVLLIHQRAHGQSGGKYITFGVKERRDVEAWVRFLTEESGVDTPIFLHGLSMGASTVMMASALPCVRDSVCGIIADCGYLSPGQEFKHVFRSSLKLPLFPFFYVAAFLTRLVCGFSFYEESTVDALSQTKIPVLLIHGEDDRFVPTECSEINYNACSGAKHKLIVQGAAHAQSYLVDTNLCERVLGDFLETYQRKK